ncbi:MAG: nuclear transport factor 2 family protein, partial [Ferruginibacter sp.]
MKLKYSLEIICFAVLILIVGCENSNHTQSNTPVGIVWSGIPGDPNFHCADRIAIKNVMEAYSLYWDNSDVERFFKLFTEDAVRIESMDGQKDVLIPMQERKAIVSERLNYFKSRGLQRRHLMANTHFLQQNDSSAHIKQYTLLTST